MPTTQLYSFQYSNKLTFIELKQFIAMVNYNLPKLKAKNATEWINGACKSDNIISIGLVSRGQYGLNSVSESIDNVLRVFNNPISFYGGGFNKYGFIKEELEDYFRFNNIDFDFIFNSDNPLNGDDEKDTQIEQLTNENKRLKNEVEKLNKEKEILKKELSEKDIGAKLRLGEFMENDPTELIIDVRVNWWGDYDPKKDNRPKQESIISYLENKGITKTMARKIEAAACPINRSK